jgi:hypothetical protein
LEGDQGDVVLLFPVGAGEAAQSVEEPFDELMAVWALTYKGHEAREEYTKWGRSPRRLRSSSDEHGGRRAMANNNNNPQDP